jgi:hypothetical protein
MRLLLVSSVLLPLLVGCSSLAPAPNPKQLIAQDQSACDAYGFKRRTDGYAQCQLRDHQRTARDESARERSRLALAKLGSDLLSPQSVTCRTTPDAYGATTTCR